MLCWKIQNKTKITTERIPCSLMGVCYWHKTVEKSQPADVLMQFLVTSNQKYRKNKIEPFNFHFHTTSRGGTLTILKYRTRLGLTETTWPVHLRPSPAHGGSNPLFVKPWIVSDVIGDQTKKKNKDGEERVSFDWDVEKSTRTIMNMLG